MLISATNRPHSKILNPTLLIVSLGVFIDSFDLFIFNAVRFPSLQELGFSGDALTKAGIQILNWQVIGMFLGGFIWGVLGDKIGRKKAVLGSIFLYSLGSIGCAFVHSLDSYSIMRFITGVGLAGELGLGAILAAETLPDAKRNWAIGIFACFSAASIFVANALPELLPWRWCYAVGGIAGLLLLLVRVIMFESPLFNALLESKIKSGFLSAFIKTPGLFKRWICCIMVYTPQVYATGFLMTLSIEVGRELNISAPVKANIALMAYFAGQFLADISGVVATSFFRRRKVVVLALLLSAMMMTVRYLTLEHASITLFYLCCFAMGLCSYFALCIFMSIEQFGTNMRATAGTSVLSSTRTTLVAVNLFYLMLHGSGMNVITSIAWVSVFVFVIGILGFLGLKETYGQTIDFIENSEKMKV